MLQDLPDVGDDLMNTDIVVPKGNERELLERAKILGFDTIIFLYGSLPKSLPSSKVIEVRCALLNPSKIKDKNVMGIAYCPSNVRASAENPAISLIAGIEDTKGDFIHHRGSAMNQVIAQICASKNKEYVVDFNSLLRSGPKKRSQLWGRISQNLVLCKKYGVKIDIMSFARIPSEMRTKKDLKAVLRIIEKNQ